ncbi:MAG: ferredoxin [Bacilli bacterium]
MKIEIKESNCIGCGACVATSPDIFSFNDDGFAEAIKEPIKEEDIEIVKDAIESCPTDAIKEINN